MKCDEIREKLNAYLDGEIEDTKEIRRHLDTCSDCRRELEALSSVNDFLSQYEDVSIPQPVIDRILAIPRRRALGSLSWFAKISIAATAAIAFFLGVVTSSEISSNSNPYEDFSIGTETLYSFDMGGEG